MSGVGGVLRKGPFLAREQDKYDRFIKVAISNRNTYSRVTISISLQKDDQMTHKAQTENKPSNSTKGVAEVQFVTGKGSGQSDVCAEKVSEPAKK